MSTTKSAFSGSFFKHLQHTASITFPALFLTLLSLIVLSLSACNKDSKTSGASSSSSDSGILSYVPADSILFVGGLEPVSIKESTQMFSENSGLFLQGFKENLKKKSPENSPPAAKMFSQLLVDYFDLLSNPDQVAQKLGIDDKSRAVIYTVGTMPVIRMKLKDKAAFDQFILASEKSAGVAAAEETIGSAKVRKYSFDNKPAPDVPALIIGTQGDYAIISAKIDKLGDEVNKQIVGDIKPKASLSVDTLKQLVASYHYDPRYLFILDHKQIVRGITRSDNQFGSMLNAIISIAQKSQAADMGQTAGENAPATQENPLAKLQTPACQKELAAKVETWPRTVGGYTTLNFAKPAKFDFKAVVEINDAKFVKSLKTLRGVLPSYIANRENNMIFGLGLGINIDAIAPFVTQFIQEFTAQNYQCEFLADMKKDMVEKNPAMGIAMMTGMASGVYGVSASLLSFEGKVDPSMQMPPDVKNLQAILTVSAKNPQMLLMMLQKMQPGMPPIQLPADGKAIDFPLPIPTPEPVKLALKGKHIVAYIGKDAAPLADAIQKQPLEGNGMFSVNLDYQKYFELLMNGPGMQAGMKQDPEMQKMMKFLETMKYRIIESMDVSDKGIELTAAMSMN